MIHVRFQPKGGAEVVVKIDRDDPTPVLDAARARIFPDVTPPERDEKWEAVMKLERAHWNRRRDDRAPNHAPTRHRQAA